MDLHTTIKVGVLMCDHRLVPSLHQERQIQVNGAILAVGKVGSIGPHSGNQPTLHTAMSMDRLSHIQCRTNRSLLPFKDHLELESVTDTLNPPTALQRDLGAVIGCIFETD
jgi:hypothetical protein